MTDRELLEKAAKAHGNIRQPEGCADFMDDDTGDWWNPLIDDGDALRLAVKLHLNLTLIPSHEGYEALTDVSVPAKNGVIDVHEYHRDDAYAATRRAIVRAAAAMGGRGSEAVH